MAIKNDKEHQIELLQTNLQTIRKIAGWTIEDFGDRLGVSKQTISNLENAKTQMKFWQKRFICCLMKRKTSQKKITKKSSRQSIRLQRQNPVEQTKRCFLPYSPEWLGRLLQELESG